MYVEHFFKLSDTVKEELHSMKPSFGYEGFSEFLFYRTYSRVKENGKNETWADVIIRVVEGCFSIRKDHYLKNHLTWDEDFWQTYSYAFAKSMFNMQWLPAGRGLWSMGTNFVYERGAMALMNCGYIDVGKDIGKCAHWVMDALMCGVGVGFTPVRDDDIRIYGNPETSINTNINTNLNINTHTIPDSREGWCDSVKLLIDSYLRPNVPHPNFDYSKIRKGGLPIKGFGGISSGPEPLIKLHDRIRMFFKMYQSLDWYDTVLLKADIINSIGSCVVAGNVRRSAEIALGSLHDETFINLKNYKKYPYREEWGGLSNNSVFLETNEDYNQLDKITERIIDNGEPGLACVKNFKYGRIGKPEDNVKKDPGNGTNPCFFGANLVLTLDGLKRFKDLKAGEYIWSELGWSKILRHWSSGIKPVYRYQTTAGYLECTEEHPVISRNKTLQIKDADVLDTLKGDDGHTFNISDLDVHDILDGLFHGDGSMDGNCPILYIGRDDFDYFKCDVRRFIGSQIKETAYRIQTTYKEIGPTYTRIVPDKFITGDVKKVCGFLRGLYSANGSVVSSRVTLKAASFRTIEDVQTMLSSIGISSYYTTNKKHFVEFRNGVYECKESYDLNIIEKDSMIQFSNLIGFIQEDKINRLNKALIKEPVKRKINFEIISKEYLGDHEVFDIEVDNRTHTFWCNGFNVHNCGEQILQSYELCNLVETFPTKCDNEKEWFKALEYATVYASTCTLLPTHRIDTNSIMFKNRRIGVSITDVMGWVHNNGRNRVTRYLREGYKIVRKINTWLADEAGIPESIRVTTIKPSGTVSKLAGVTSGANYPTFKHTLRRVRVAANSPIVKILQDANVPNEPDVFSDNTLVFSFPILQGPAKTGMDASLFEQAFNIVMLQREWSDNSVSNTLYFKPKWIKIQDLSLDNLHELKVDIDPKIFDYQDLYQTKEYKIEVNRDYNSLAVYKYNPNHEEDVVLDVLSSIAPHVKSISMLPLSYEGCYKQMPEEGITEEAFNNLKKSIKPINWAVLSNADAIGEVYCTNDRCEIR